MPDIAIGSTENELEFSSGNERQGPFWGDTCCGCSGDLSLSDLEKIRDFCNAEIRRLRQANV